MELVEFMSVYPTAAVGYTTLFLRLHQVDACFCCATDIEIERESWRIVVREFEYKYMLNGTEKSRLRYLRRLDRVLLVVRQS